jgi:ribosome biogenesis GTPase A
VYRHPPGTAGGQLLLAVAAPVDGELQRGAVARMLVAEELLAAIGRQRGALLGKGRVNLQKAAEIVMTEFRAGALGRVTLETVAEFAAWQAAAQAADAQRAARKAARKRAQ